MACIELSESMHINFKDHMFLILYGLNFEKL